MTDREQVSGKTTIGLQFLPRRVAAQIRDEVKRSRVSIALLHVDDSDHVRVDRAVRRNTSLFGLARSCLQPSRSRRHVERERRVSARCPNTRSRVLAIDERNTVCMDR